MIDTTRDSERLMAKEGALGRPELGLSFPPLAAEHYFDQWVFRQSARVGSSMMNPIGEIKPPLAQSQ